MNNLVSKRSKQKLLLKSSNESLSIVYTCIYNKYILYIQNILIVCLNVGTRISWLKDRADCIVHFGCV